MYRDIINHIENVINSGNSIVLILGLRQTGKTTLAKSVCSGKKFQMFNFDLNSDKNEFQNHNRHSLELFAERYKDQVIFIDEIQKLPESTEIIKYLFDEYKMKFILTGSSELKIKNNLGDSLAGRIRIFKLYPLSIKEILIQKNTINPDEKIPYEEYKKEFQKYLVFGSLPAVQNLNPYEYIPFLKDFTESILSKDVLEIANIKKSTKIYAIAKLLALQIGQLVNVNELALKTELSRTSVYNYLDILEQLNIIFRAYPLSTNNRRAISEKFKVYFTDIGMRNYLVNNFENINMRLDSGFLLENAVFLGLKRKLDYQQKIYELGFFRSETGSEIDMVLKEGNAEKYFEVKSNNKYSRKTGEIVYINPDNAGEFL